MSQISTLLQVVQVLSSLGIIALVLLQQGKGADMGSAFGSGSAGSLFGASGAANFLSRMTKWAAIVFFASTMALAWWAHPGASKEVDSGGVMQQFNSSVPGLELPVPQQSVPSQSVPTAPDSNASSAAVPGAEETTGTEAPASEAAVPAQATDETEAGGADKAK